AAAVHRAGRARLHGLRDRRRRDLDLSGRDPDPPGRPPPAGLVTPEATDLDAIDHLLSTTRAVRKRLDLDRPVPPEIVEECLRLAIQAPTGSNRQGWHWVIVIDADERAALADMYRAGFGPYMDRARSGSEGMTRVGESALWLAERLEQVPVHGLPCIDDATTGDGHHRVV